MAIFNSEAENYDKWYKTKMGEHVDRVETECAFSLFNVKPGMRLLDIGCGTGNFSIKLARQGVSVTGIDASTKMLAKAQEKAEKEGLEIEFKEMDCLNLQFPDNTFDGVLSMATIEFIADYPRMISEMFRVCKKGGYILVGTINRDSSWGELYQDENYLKIVKVFRYANFKTPEELNLIKTEQVKKVRECLFIPPDSPDNDINQAREEELSHSQRGGFFCVLWRKD